MIKAIIFDCFGVLTTDHWREFVASLPEHVRTEASDLNHACDAGYISREEFNEQITALTGKSPQYYEKLSPDEVPKNHQLMTYIQNELKASYKIGLLSNVSTDWVTAQFLSSAEQELFDEMVFSYQVALAKPNPEIFTLTAAKLEVEPDSCIMIDDVLRNCDGAKSVGMQAVHYRDLQQSVGELRQLLA